MPHTALPPRGEPLSPPVPKNPDSSWLHVEEHEPPMEGIYFILRVPYVGVASWSPERRLWYQIDTFQEPLDRGYVTYWAYLTDTGEDLTRLIKAGMSFPQLPPWYSHTALAMEARREALQMSSLYGVPLDAVTNPALYTGPFVGGAYRRLINERLHAMLLDTTYAELDLGAALCSGRAPRRLSCGQRYWMAHSLMPWPHSSSVGVQAGSRPT